MSESTPSGATEVLGPDPKQFELVSSRKGDGTAAGYCAIKSKLYGVDIVFLFQDSPEDQFSKTGPDPKDKGNVLSNKNFRGNLAGGRVKNHPYFSHLVAHNSNFFSPLKERLCEETTAIMKTIKGGSDRSGVTRHLDDTMTALNKWLGNTGKSNTQQLNLVVCIGGVVEKACDEEAIILRELQTAWRNFTKCL